MFRQGGMATVNTGVDAWRRIVRYIDHGRGIRLELMRNRWRTIRSRPIKSLEAVTIGIAEFETRFSITSTPEGSNLARTK